MKNTVRRTISPQEVAEFIFKEGLQPETYVKEVRKRLYELVKSSGNIAREMARLGTHRSKMYYWAPTPGISYTAFKDKK